MMGSGGMGDWEIGLESANGEIPRQHREVMENGGALCTIFSILLDTSNVGVNIADAD